MRLRDKFWLWGHPEGCFNQSERWNHWGTSRMTPMEGCLYLGVKNVFMVPVHVNVNRRQYNKSFQTLNHVGWETYAAAQDPSILEAYIQEAADFPNINSVVYDDLHDNNGAVYTDIPVENLWKGRERLHNNPVRPLEMWMVLYTRDFGLDKDKDRDFQQYMAPFDGVILWTWEEKDVPLIPEKFELLKTLMPDQRKMFGCYLYNFGERKQATSEAVTWQLDWYREKLYQGEAEGVVLHTNTMADLDYEAYDAAVAWMELHGDEEID